MTRTKPIVIDVCLVLAWVFGEAVHEEAVERTLGFLKTGSAIVPSVWSIEVVGGLVVGERTGRIQPEVSDVFLEHLSSLPITIDDGAASRAFEDVLELARRHGLRSKDACYLELALRHGLRLATVDKDLESAARRGGCSFMDSISEAQLFIDAQGMFRQMRGIRPLDLGSVSRSEVIAKLNALAMEAEAAGIFPPEALPRLSRDASLADATAATNQIAEAFARRFPDLPIEPFGE